MVSGHKNKHRQTRMELNEKNSESSGVLKKALDAEAKGAAQKAEQLLSRQLLHKRTASPSRRKCWEKCNDPNDGTLPADYLPHDAQGNQRYREGRGTAKRYPIGDYENTIANAPRHPRGLPRGSLLINRRIDASR